MAAKKVRKKKLPKRKITEHCSYRRTYDEDYNLISEVIFKKKVQHFLGRDLHNENGPARILKNGTEEWYLNGKRHRKEGPAINHKNGHKEWWINGFLHRGDGPAIILANEASYYYNNNGKYKWQLLNINLDKKEFDSWIARIKRVFLVRAKHMFLREI